MREPEEPLLELGDIQGHVLVGFGAGFQILLGLRLDPGRVTEAKAALLPWAERVTTAREATRSRFERRVAKAEGLRKLPEPGLRLAISFSRTGLRLLGAIGKPADPLFAAGAAASAFELRDAVDAAGKPVDWKVGDSEITTPHVFVILAAEVEDEVAAGCAELLASLGDCFEVIYRDAGRRLENDREHFGFVDGVSQPGIRGVVESGTFFTERSFPAGHPLAHSHSRPGQALVWPGQFVFGYPTQKNDDPRPGDPIGFGDSLLHNGSLLVFRRLRQHVAAFRAAMQQLAEAFTAKGLPIDAATAAAFCVGRWPDGTPVSLSPGGPNPSISGDKFRRNGFDYRQALAPATLEDPLDGMVSFPGAAADAEGRSCPFFAHIRKVNPRDQPPDQGSVGVTLRSQMLRRAITYGPDAPNGADDDEDRGLLFMSYQTSIVNQFHRLMTLWVNNASAPLGDGPDPLIGSSSPAGRPLRRRTSATLDHRVRLGGNWVTATGAGYFFTPGISALRRLLG